MDRLRIREVELSDSNAIAAIMMPGIRDGRTYAWQSLGFDVVGRLPDPFRHADGSLVDALVMVRSLI